MPGSSSTKSLTFRKPPSPPASIRKLPEAELSELLEPASASHRCDERLHLVESYLSLRGKITTLGRDMGLAKSAARLDPSAEKMLAAVTERSDRLHEEWNDVRDRLKCYLSWPAPAAVATSVEVESQNLGLCANVVELLEMGRAVNEAAGAAEEHRLAHHPADHSQDVTRTLNDAELANLGTSVVQFEEEMSVYSKIGTANDPTAALLVLDEAVRKQQVDILEKEGELERANQVIEEMQARLARLEADQASRREYIDALERELELRDMAEFPKSFSDALRELVSPQLRAGARTMVEDFRTDIQQMLMDEIESAYMLQYPNSEKMLNMALAVRER
ncbi:hypothetical protein FISHEDRAFT_78379 [Fistulina hepatica ATCC 64428]|nr:hypothetical protein FISHEDRAFT_78379 [Fistulina hepatica ATCC 64428]